MMYHAAVLTVSDRSFAGERPDTAGPLVAQLLEEAGYQVVCTAIVPDVQPQIEAFLKDTADRQVAQLLVTTGGTGFAPPGRDAGGYSGGVPAADARHPGGYALRLHAGDQPGHAVPGPGGHPGRDSHHQSARFSQSRPGKPGGRAAGAAPRAGNAVGPAS